MLISAFVYRVINRGVPSNYRGNNVGASLLHINNIARRHYYRNIYYLPFFIYVNVFGDIGIQFNRLQSRYSIEDFALKLVALAYISEVSRV